MPIATLRVLPKEVKGMLKRLLSPLVVISLHMEWIRGLTTGNLNLGRDALCLHADLTNHASDAGNLCQE